MTIEFTFLSVGNGDCIIIREEKKPLIIVDMHGTRPLRDWLAAQGALEIERIYFTHRHRDHVPDAEDLAAFLQDRSEEITITAPFNLMQIISRQMKQLRLKKEGDPVAARQLQKLRGAYELLDEANLKGRLHSEVVWSDSRIYQRGALSIRVLHPRSAFFNQSDEQTGSPNPPSLVLRVSYHKFSAVLLADIEGTGVNECLMVADRDPLAFPAQLVKIPHHGAWPDNGEELEKLLEHIDPQYAVLSVGSTNVYAHVDPELFRALLRLRCPDRPIPKRLKTFVCTEQTQTCVKPIHLRAPVGTPGLSSIRSCAGNVRVLAHEDGQIQLPDREAHESVLSSVPYAVCQMRGELWPPLPARELNRRNRKPQ